MDFFSYYICVPRFLLINNIGHGAIRALTSLKCRRVAHPKLSRLWRISLTFLDEKKSFCLVAFCRQVPKLHLVLLT